MGAGIHKELMEPEDRKDRIGRVLEEADGREAGGAGVYA